MLESDQDIRVQNILHSTTLQHYAIYGASEAMN